MLPSSQRSSLNASFSLAVDSAKHAMPGYIPTPGKKKTEPLIALGCHQGGGERAGGVLISTAGQIT